MQNQVAAALEQPYEDLKRALADEPQLFMDESPTKEGDRKAWLWTAVAPLFAVFAIFASRKAEALPKLLGNAFTGVINSDRCQDVLAGQTVAMVLGPFEARFSGPDWSSTVMPEVLTGT